MLKLRKNQIYMTRGDSARVGLKIKIPVFPYDEYEMKPGDKCLFTCRKLQFCKEDQKNSPIIFQFEILSDGIIDIIPEYTEDLPYGDYLYDIELTLENGEIHTIIEPTILKITREVNC